MHPTKTNPDLEVISFEDDAVDFLKVILKNNSPNLVMAVKFVTTPRWIEHFCVTPNKVILSPGGEEAEVEVSARRRFHEVPEDAKKAKLNIR